VPWYIVTLLTQPNHSSARFCFPGSAVHVSPHHRVKTTPTASSGAVEDAEEEQPLSAAELARKAKAEECYFAQRKAGARPSGSAAADTEELVSFVEDGLNRGAKSKPKPLLGAAKRAAEAAAKRAAKAAAAAPQDLLLRTLVGLGAPAKGSCPPALGKCLDNAACLTELLLACGVGGPALGAFASTCRRAAVATREPDWRRLADGLCSAHGLLAVDLQPEHPAAPRAPNGWKARFAALFKERHAKWGGPVEAPGLVQAAAAAGSGSSGGGAKGAAAAAKAGTTAKADTAAAKASPRGLSSAKAPLSSSPGAARPRSSGGARVATSTTRPSLASPKGPVARKTSAARASKATPAAAPAAVAAPVAANSFKMTVIVRFRPSVERPGQVVADGDRDGDVDAENAMFLPLHQRLQLEKLGHNTSLEAEVHERMTDAKKSGSKGFVEQKLDRSAADTKQAAAETAAAENDGYPVPLGSRQFVSPPKVPPSGDSGGGDGAALGRDPSPLDSIRDKARATWMAAAARADGDADGGPDGYPDGNANAAGDAIGGGADLERMAAASGGKGGGGEGGGEGDARPRQTFRAKIVNVEETRVLVNLPGAGLRCVGGAP